MMKLINKDAFHIRFGRFWKLETVSERLNVTEETVQKETEKTSLFMC